MMLGANYDLRGHQIGAIFTTQRRQFHVEKRCQSDHSDGIVCQPLNCSLRVENGWYQGLNILFYCSSKYLSPLLRMSHEHIARGLRFRPPEIEMREARPGRNERASHSAPFLFPSSSSACDGEARRIHSLIL